MRPSLSSQDVQALTATLSHARMEFWKGLAGGDPYRALLLHRRNALASGLLLADLQIFEVALRNGFDAELRKTYSPTDWLDHAEFKDTKPVTDARKHAKKELERSRIRRPPSRDEIIVQLGFGFWKVLFDTPPLRPNLLRAFKHFNPPIDGAYVKRSLKALHQLRNELAHHEPVIIRDGVHHSENLNSILESLHNLLVGLCPVTADWAQRHSFVRVLVDTKLLSCDEPGEHHVPFLVP